MTTTRVPRGRRPDQEPDPAPQSRRDSGTRSAVSGIQRVFGAQNGNFFLLLGTTMFLVVFGLVMVLSSSSIEDGSKSNHDFFTSFTRQALYVIIGVPLMLIASRMPAKFWKRWAWPAVVGTLALQLLVFIPGLGYGYQGNQNWIRIGAFTAQPSELVKLALVLWISWVIAAKKNLLRDWRHVALPIAPVALVAIGLVLVGKDLGTAIILVSIVLGLLFYGGVRLRYIAFAGVIIGIIGTAFTFGSKVRAARIVAWADGCSAAKDQGTVCWQTVHGWWGIASGGVFGSGLGQSKVKWNWLPEADNDFIFAIIGEELGLIGAVLVLALFVVLAISFVRIIRASTDDFQRVVTSGVMIWLIGEGFVNIAVVLGFLPVLGVPLPLISAGGSSLIASLVAIGVVLSFTRSAAVRG